jgi:hypothetical protein
MNLPFAGEKQINEIASLSFRPYNSMVYSRPSDRDMSDLPKAFWAAISESPYNLNQSYANLYGLPDYGPDFAVPLPAFPERDPRKLNGRSLRHPLILNLSSTESSAVPGPVLSATMHFTPSFHFAPDVPRKTEIQSDFLVHPIVNPALELSAQSFVREMANVPSFEIVNSDGEISLALGK